MSIKTIDTSLKKNGNLESVKAYNANDLCAHAGITASEGLIKDFLSDYDQREDKDYTIVDGEYYFLRPTAKKFITSKVPWFKVIDLFLDELIKGGQMSIKSIDTPVRKNGNVESVTAYNASDLCAHIGITASESLMKDFISDHDQREDKDYTIVDGEYYFLHLTATKFIAARVSYFNMVELFIDKLTKGEEIMATNPDTESYEKLITIIPAQPGYTIVMAGKEGCYLHEEVIAWRIETPLDDSYGTRTFCTPITATGAAKPQCVGIREPSGVVTSPNNIFSSLEHFSQFADYSPVMSRDFSLKQD